MFHTFWSLRLIRTQQSCFKTQAPPKPSDVVFCQGSALSLEGILTAAAKREDDGAYAEPLGAWLDELTGTGNQSAGDQSAGEETIWFTLKFERWKWDETER